MTARLTRWLNTLDNFETKMAQLPSVRRYGRLTRATGLVLEATGLQLPLGATCVIERQDGGETREVESEVVGFNGQRLFLMPLEEVEGILPGARVYAKNISGDGLQSGKQLPLGPALLGRVLDGSGKPLDGLPSPDTTETGALITQPFNPLQRTPIEHVLDTGVRPINALLTVGRGQRMGLFAGSGVGKSVLLGMMARYTQADVIVVGLIGERGREVKDFIENILGAEGRARSVVIAAPADVSPLLRILRRYMAAHPDLAARFAKFDLFKPQIIRVILNPVKLTFSEHDGGSRMLPNYVCDLDNPLFLVSQESAQ